MIATSLFARRMLILTLAGALLAVAFLVGQAPTRAAATEADEATTTSAAHPYGQPLWFPLHDPADIGCAKTACGAYKAHGYWALDFTGNLGDPVFAAGAGVLHIGGRGNGCAQNGGSDVEGGNWVWVDHGAGVVSRYHHLDTITATEGQLVTPATQIGTMGHSGDIAPCTINYLHFEVRHGGLKGTRVDPGQLNVCSAEGLVSMPKAFGATSWDDPKIHTRPRIKTLAGDTSCMTADWLTTPDRPTVKVGRQSGALLASWTPPTAAGTSVVLALQTYHPSLKAWGDPSYVSPVAGAASYRFAGLENGRSYRVTAYHRNAAGTSLPSAAVQLIPAGAPAAPTGPRYASWTKRDYIHYGWNRPVNNGSTVTSFTVAWRCAVKGQKLSKWSLATQGEKDTYRNLRGLSRVNICQVKVLGTNGVGAGAWSATKIVRLGDR